MNGLFVVSVDVILSPVVPKIRPPDPTPLLQPHYRAFIAPTSRSAPIPCVGTLASRFWPLVLLPWHQGTVPAVPRKSLCPTHAPYTPVAVRTVIRLPADLSQEKKAPPVLTTLDTLTSRHRWVCLRSSFPHSPALGHA